MQTFQEFVVECSQIDESSLSRIKSKSDKSGKETKVGERSLVVTPGKSGKKKFKKKVEKLGTEQGMKQKRLRELNK